MKCITSLKWLGSDKLSMFQIDYWYYIMTAELTRKNAFNVLLIAAVIERSVKFVDDKKLSNSDSV